MYDITITIVAYKNYDDIISAVKSVAEHTNNSIQKKLYIVDNSCLDDNNEYRKNFIDLLREYVFVEYIDSNKNLGFGKAHNLVINSLKSKYHVIMNPDILLVEDTLQILIDYLDKNDIGMCIPKLIDSEGNIQMAYRREVTVFDMFIRMFMKKGFKKRKAYHTMKDKDFSKPFEVPFAQGSFLVIRTSLFKQLGGFDDRFFMYMEDADLCKRVNQISKVFYCPYTKVIHKWEKGSHKNVRLFKNHVASMIKYFAKWGFK